LIYFWFRFGFADSVVSLSWCVAVQIVVGSLDFVAINYYFPYVTSPGTMTDADTPSFFKDMNITRWVCMLFVLLCAFVCCGLMLSVHWLLPCPLGAGWAESFSVDLL
jgi:hypothetical protein